MKKILIIAIIILPFISFASEKYNLPDTDVILKNIIPVANKVQTEKSDSPALKFAKEAATKLRKDLKYYHIDAKISVINISEVPTKEEYALAVEFKNWKDYEKVKDLFYQDPEPNPGYMGLKVFPRVPKNIIKTLDLNKNLSFSELEEIGNKIKVCWLKNIEKDNCVYKCKDGSIYTTPIQRPWPYNENENYIACPQLVFPF